MDIIDDNLFDEINSYLNILKYKKKYIKRNSLHTVNDINKIKILVNLFGSSYVSEIAEKAEDANSAPFYAQLECSKCKILYIKSYGKEKFFTKIMDVHICDNCEHLENIKKDEYIKKINMENEILNEEEKEKYTDHFIDKYILTISDAQNDTPFKNWNSMLSVYNKSNQKRIIQYIKVLKYRIFLNTNYWKIISRYKKYRSAYKCELCNNENNLHVHHKTYDNHGTEINIEVLLKDLIVLCKTCHHKFHDKIYNGE